MDQNNSHDTNKDFDHKTESGSVHSNEEEITRIMKQYSSVPLSGDGAKADSKDLDAPVDKSVMASADTDEPETLTMTSAPETPGDGDSTDSSQPKSKRTARKIGNWFLSLLPNKKDSPLEITRKVIFLVSLITLIVTSIYLINDMGVQPAINREIQQQTEDLYNPDNPAKVPSKYADVSFPDGMTDVLKAMYAINSDTRGYIVYKASGTDFLNIQYPVMWKNNNSYYLTHDFHKEANKHGSIFLDYRNNYLTKGAYNKCTILYGHNMINGQMFSNLNQFLGNNGKPNLSKVRAATTFKMETLFDRREYQLFAIDVFDQDTKIPAEYRYGYNRTGFSSDAEFMDYIANIRARSICNFPTQVGKNDEIIILSTCTTSSAVKLDDARFVVFAKRIDNQSSSPMNTSKITYNSNVIMPYNWYINNKKPVHSFYKTGIVPGIDGVYGMPTTTTATSKATTAKPGTSTTTKKGTTTKPTTKSSDASKVTSTGGKDTSSSKDTSGSKDTSSSKVTSTSKDTSGAATTTKSEPATSATTTTTKPPESSTPSEASDTSPGE